jgi:hypothetical protein
VYSADPVALYQVNKVLLPEAIFGTDIPPVPAPAPAPDIAPAADSPMGDGGKGSSGDSSSSSSGGCEKILSLRVWSNLVLGICGILALVI